MVFVRCLVTFLLATGINHGLPIHNHRDAVEGPEPPPLKFKTNLPIGHDLLEIFNRVITWTSPDEVNVWELSGLFEGDILVPTKKGKKHGLIDVNFRWPGGVVPFYVPRNVFVSWQLDAIWDAMYQLESQTCVRFRQYQYGDRDFILIQGSGAGCWSAVGRHTGGQPVNLQPNWCTDVGSIVHELLHALGFYHQHSAADRDNYVQILWNNIKPNYTSNFEKYNSTTVTDFGVGYDYGSIMHYERKAFSRNGLDTIVPLQPGVQLGRRNGASPKDIEKLKKMYESECFP